MSIGEIIAVITFSMSIIGEMVAVFRKLKKIAEGTKCQLRTEMLNIYYAHKDEETPTIRQLEYENFEKLFLAYKNLHGNSFIDRCYTEITENWRVTQ